MTASFGLFRAHPVDMIYAEVNSMGSCGDSGTGALWTDDPTKLIYIYGDNNPENLHRQDHTWKVRLIEEDFHRLMFDVKDV